MNSSNSSATLYGRIAYEGFARAIGSQLGLSVVVDDGASGCIDAGGTIRIPGLRNYQTAAEFENTCATLVHELAHQFYGSHLRLDPSRSRIAALAFNAVVDVADESWLARYCERVQNNARPGALLDVGASSALSEHWTRYCDWRDTSTHAWKVAVVGIFYARLPHDPSVRRLARHTVARARRFGVDARAVFRLLRSAVVRANCDGRLVERNRRAWRKIDDLTARIAAILAPFAPTEANQAPVGRAPGDQPGTGMAGALAAGASELPAGAVEADADAGESKADATTPQQQTGRGGYASGGGRRGAGGSRGSAHGASVATFNALYPAVVRVAERIALDGESLDRESGMTTGGMIGQAHRFFTDGACLSRWNVDDQREGMAVAVVLDCSISMQDMLTEAAGVARAFVKAMRDAGDVGAFAFGDDVIDVADDFERPYTLGFTATDAALIRATDWLATRRAGRKFIVLITDGAPNSPLDADAAAARAAAAGVKIFAVGLACNISLAHATIATAPDVTRLAIQLDAAARAIEYA